MTRPDYSAPLIGDERIIDRPDGTQLRTVAAGDGASDINRCVVRVAGDLRAAGRVAVAFE